MVGITLAYVGFGGLRALDQHRTNGRRRANKTADKIPALAQKMIAIWDVHVISDQT